MKPYSLRAYTSVLGASQQFVRSLTEAAVGWKRSVRGMGGFWIGTFQMAGTAGDLQQAFDQWLGYHLQEQYAGQTSWEGMIYEMELARGSVRRRRSLDELANAVRATYTVLAFAGDDLINGGTFASLDSWRSSAGTDGSVSLDAGAANLHGDSDASYTITYIRQNVQVQEGTRYQLTFKMKGDGTQGGYYGVRDPNGSVWIVGPTLATTAAAYTNYAVAFTAPALGEVLIYFYAPLDDPHECWVDDVTLKEEIEVLTQTDWALDAASITRYGRKEEILVLDRYPAATSETLRDTTLAERGTPKPQAASFGARGETTLDVSACGYIFTANWQRVVEGDGADHDLSHWISAIVGSAFGLSANHGGAVAGAGDCQFLKTGRISSNTLQATEETSLDEPAWDRLREMAELGDSNGDPWRLYCDAGRRVYYEKMSATPRYYLLNGRIVDRLSAASGAAPWLLRPAVVRDMDYPAGRTEPGSWLGDARDVYIEEFEVDEAGTVTPKPALYSEVETLNAQLRGQGL